MKLQKDRKERMGKMAAKVEGMGHTSDIYIYMAMNAFDNRSIGCSFLVINLYRK